MRYIIVIAAAFALSACAQPPAAPSAAAGCVRSGTHAVTWSDSDAPDVITTRSEGPSCAQAVVLFVARDAAGNPLWTFASTYYDMTTGGVPPENALAVTNAQMDAFLSGWANVSKSTSGSLPEWRAGAAGPAGPTFTYNTAFERDTYEALRAHDLPMICYAAAAEATQCLVVDPSSHAPTVIVAYGP